MGGSIAKALRSSAAPEDKIYALDKNNESLYAALTSGIINKAFTPSETKQMLAEADMLFVCLYPAATLDFFKEHRYDYKNGAIITDIHGRNPSEQCKSDFRPPNGRW